MSESWLDLLLRDASPEELVRHGDPAAQEALRAAGMQDAVYADSAAEAERQTAAALRLQAQLQQRAQRANELSALNDVAGRLAALHAPDDLLPEIVEQARRLLGVDLAYLGLLEEGELRLKVTSGALTPELVDLAVPLSKGLVGKVIAHSAPMWTSDYRAARTFPHHEKADAAATAENMRGLLGVPLRLRGRVLGALFAAKRQERHFTEHEVTLLSALAAHASVAIDNARTLEQLTAANEQLARRTTTLEQTLRWDQRLTRVVLGGGGIEELIAEVASVAEDTVLFVPRGAALPPELAAVEDAVAPTLDAPPDEPVLLTPTSGSYVLCRRVAAGQRDFGTLVLTGTGQPGDDDERLLDRAVPALALALVGEHAAAEATRRTRDSFLIDLVTTRGGDTRTRSRQMRLAGLDPQASYTVMVAEPTGGSTVAQARRALERLAPDGDTVIAEHGTGLVAVLPTSRPEELRDDWARPYDAPAAATAGICGPARGAVALARCFAEAQQTLSALAALDRHGEAATADQLGLYRVLLSHTGRRQLDTVFEELLGPLRAEQDRRGVPLLETVRVFLNQGSRPKAAAEQLGVHINTLYQRLATVDRTLGTHWREPRHSLDLQLLFRLRIGSAALEA